MAGKHKLRKAYKKLDIQKADEITPVPGILGFPINGVNTVEVQNRPGYVYVRLRDNQSEVVQAFNTNVSPVYGLPVLITRDKINKSRYIVLSRDLGRYENWGTSSPYLPRHGAQHSFDPLAVGGDIVWVYNRQFMPLNVYPSGSSGAMDVLISPGTYYRNNLWHYAGGTGTVSFVSYKPTGSSARMVLVYLDENDNPQLEGGSFFASTLTGTAQLVSYIPSVPTTNALPLAGIRLVSGTSIISWDNIYDIRPFIIGDGFIPTGTSGGHVIADEGTPLTARPTLNFIGANVWAVDNAGSDETDVIISGSVATPISLNDLTDVVITSPTHNQTLSYSTGTLQWINEDYSSVMTLDSLAGVSVPSPNNGDVLTYDSGDFGLGWYARPGSGGGGTIAIQQDSVFKVSGTAISFDNGLEVSVVGSTAHVTYTGTSASSSSGSYDPLDFNQLNFRDEFIWGSTAAGTIGELGWILVGNGAVSLQAGTQDHPGWIAIRSGTGNGNKETVTASSANPPILGNQIDKSKFIFKQLAPSTGTFWRVGFGADWTSAANLGADGVYLEYNSYSGTTLSFYTRAASAQESTILSGLSGTAGNWMMVDFIWVTGTNTVQCWVNDVLKATHSIVPSAALNFGMMIWNVSGSTQKELDWDFFSMKTLPLGQRWT